MPGRPLRLQSFSEWSDIVRGAIIWVGLEDPVETQDRLRENDPTRAKLIQVATAWRNAFPYSMTAAEAVEMADEKVTTGAYGDLKTEFANPELRDALLAASRHGERVNQERLGNYLRSVLDNVRFEKDGKKQGAVLWTLVTVA
jgi:putative DNA primase/helicase